jgi:hypothetical protein
LRVYRRVKSCQKKDADRRGHHDFQERKAGPISQTINYHGYFPVPEVDELDEEEEEELDELDPDVPLDEELELEELKSSVLPF